MKEKKEPPLHVRASKEFKDHIKRACSLKGWSTMSDYVRQAVRNQLERDGVK